MKKAAAILGVLLVTLPGISNAALIAEQPDNSSSQIFHTTNQVMAHAPAFTAVGNHGLGSFASIYVDTAQCSATSTGLLRFSAKIPSGYGLFAGIMHDSATPTPHGINHIFWGDLPTCRPHLQGNNVMTDYEMPVSLPYPQPQFPDTGILDGNTYHLVFGESAGWTIDTEFKTNPAGDIFYQLFDDATSTPATTTPALDPVIVIPGILGSEEHNGVWEIDPILHSYDDLIGTLDANDYTLNVNLFSFPYDWRKSNVDTAILLKQKIDQVKQICQCSKVDLVAHSMGGLAARQYIQSAVYEQDVDQLIFLGTPHLGAPKAYLMWEGGEFGVQNNTLDELTQSILEHEGSEKGYSSLYEYIHSPNIRSVEQLLPVYSYIFDGNNLRDYHGINYPRNLFLENLESTVNSLYASGVRITSITGNSSGPTISGIQAIPTAQYFPLWQNGYPQNYYDLTGSHGLIFGSGDETVPTASASHLSVGTVSTSSAHADLPSVGASFVYKTLTNHDAVTIVSGQSRLDIKMLYFKVKSPVDMLIISPDGRRVGRDTTDGAEVNEIPNSFYTGFNTDTEFVTIPNPQDGEYRVITRGTGAGGKFTVETAYIDDGHSSEVSFTGSTTPGQILELKALVDNISSSVTSIKPTDSTPPSILIAKPVSQDYERTQILPVQVSSADASGVLSIVTKLGTTTIPNVGSVDLFFLKLGKYTLVASSTDNVGNTSTSSVSFRIIATPDSTLSDVERAYSLGWMTKVTRDTLVKRLQAAIKISKVVVRATDGRPQSEQVKKVVDKILAAAMLIEIRVFRGKGLNEQAYGILREDLTWLISN